MELYQIYTSKLSDFNLSDLKYPNELHKYAIKNDLIYYHDLSENTIWFENHKFQKMLEAKELKLN